MYNCKINDRNSKTNDEIINSIRKINDDLYKR